MTAAAGAHNTYVLDACCNMWCAARAVDWATVGSAVTPESMLAEGVVVPSLLEASLRSLKKPLQRGGKLDGRMEQRHNHAYLRSFAGIYVLMVRFAGPFDLQRVRGVVAVALPDIERLTAALPPPDGPGEGSGEGVSIA